MAIEVVLLDNIDTLGVCGDKVRVSEGYARNFLFPRKLAVCATKAVEKQISKRQEKVAAEYAAKVAAAQEVGRRVSETTLTIPMQAGDDEKLFGAVTSTDVHRLLTAEGIAVDRRAIHFIDPIRKLGVHEVSVKIHKEVSANLKVWVVKA